MVAFHGANVVVTGGTGALGTAVVAALVEAGAQVHVPCANSVEGERFAFRDHGQVNLVAVSNLADEAEVSRLYDTVPKLWASIQLVGGFAADNKDAHHTRRQHPVDGTLPGVNAAR